jgi:co-chaperonin GroES (HSP10)
MNHNYRLLDPNYIQVTPDVSRDVELPPLLTQEPTIAASVIDLPFPKITPYGERVIIRELQRPDTVRPDSIIIVPDAYRKRPCIGQVVSVGVPAIGEFVYDYDSELDALLGNVRLVDLLQQGDFILFSDVAGTEFEYDGQRLRRVMRCDILALVEPTSAMTYLQGGHDAGFIKELLDEAGRK